MLLGCQRNKICLPVHFVLLKCDALCADVYDRLTPKGKKPLLSTLIITQLTSGLWHGIFPGYALFFLSCAKPSICDLCYACSPWMLSSAWVSRSSRLAEASIRDPYLQTP